MAELEDTNLLHRGGRNGLDFARKEASRIAAIRDFEKRIYELAVLDTEMISRNLSPGGSADMLALAYLLERWRMMNEYPASE
jgi:triphosphoribosyl-dephospho-CoA synthetase